MCVGGGKADAVMAEGEQGMWTTSSTVVRRRARASLRAAHRRLLAWTRPAAEPLVSGAVGDLTRTKTALIAENAFLRQQLIIVRRNVKRPRCAPAERTLLVLLAGRVRAWRQARLIVQPETLYGFGTS